MGILFSLNHGKPARQGLGQRPVHLSFGQAKLRGLTEVIL